MLDKKQVAINSILELNEDNYFKMKITLTDYGRMGFSRLHSKKNWREPSALRLYNLGCQAYDLYEKSDIF